MSTSRIIGIDFGTSTTVVSFKDYKEKEELIPKKPPEKIIFEGKPTIQSIVFETEYGELLFGDEAEHYSGNGTLHSNFKMNLLSQDEKIFEKTEQLILEFFKHLREIYLDQLPEIGSVNNEITKISYPAKWSLDLRNLMKNLAKEAGFNNVFGMDEPTAAINSLLYQYSDTLIKNKHINFHKDTNVLMLDMGAGTMDLVYSVFSLGSSKPLKVIKSWPNSDAEYMFGGREIDEKLSDYCIDYLGKYNYDYNNRRQLITTNVKKWKENELSKSLNKGRSLPGRPSFLTSIINSSEVIGFDICDAESFENHVSDLFDQFKWLLKSLARELDKNKISLFKDTDLIILTGGNSEWYFIKEFLLGKRYCNGENIKFEKITDNSILSMTRPQETVSYGLVLNDELVKATSNKILEKTNSNKTEKTKLNPVNSKTNSNINNQTKNKAVINNVTIDKSSNETAAKKGLYYKKLEDLQPVVDLINEAALAIGDSKRELNDSPIGNIIKGVTSGVGIGAGTSIAVLYASGTTIGLSAAGIATGFAATGVFVLAAPIAILGVSGGAIAAAMRAKKIKQQLIDEKTRMIEELSTKIVAVNRLINSEQYKSENRKTYLKGLAMLLEHARLELQHDINL